ncbi:hypothetical protein MHBO_004251, partial [Bonamia ostreae]
MPANVFADNVKSREAIMNPNRVYKNKIVKEWLTDVNIVDGDMMVGRYSLDMQEELLNDEDIAKSLADPSSVTFNQLFVGKVKTDPEYQSIVRILSDHNISGYTIDGFNTAITNPDVLDMMRNMKPGKEPFNTKMVDERAQVFFKSNLYSYPDFEKQYYPKINHDQSVQVRAKFANVLNKTYNKKAEEKALRVVGIDSVKTSEAYERRRQYASKLKSDIYTDLARIKDEIKANKIYRANNKYEFNKSLITKDYSILTRDVNGVNATAINMGSLK